MCAYFFIWKPQYLILGSLLQLGKIFPISQFIFEHKKGWKNISNSNLVSFQKNYVYKLASVKSRNRTKITSTKTRKHAPKSNIFHLLLLSEFFELLIFSLSHHYQTSYELKIQTTCFRNKHRKKCLPPFCQKSIFPGYCWRFGVVSTVSDLLEAWVWLLKRARPRLQYTRRPL